MFFRKSFLFILICLVQVVQAQTNNAEQKALVLATYTYSTNNRLANLQPLAAYLKAETGLNVVAESYPTVQKLIEAISQGRVDFAMINTLGYLSFYKKYPGVAEPLVTLHQGEGGVTNYGGCIIASKASGLRTITDVLMRDSIYMFAMVKDASTSGNLVPRLLLNGNGIGNADGRFRLYYAGTHKQVVEDVLSGKATLGGCGCDEYEKNARASGFTDKVIKLGSFNDIPLGPVVYRKTLNNAIVRKVEAALLKVHNAKPDVFRNFCNGWTEFSDAKKFRKANDEDYNKFRSMFGSNESLWQLLDK